MPDLTQILTVYLVTINVATFLVYGLDKWKDKQSMWRVREAALLLMSKKKYFLINLYSLY